MERAEVFRVNLRRLLKTRWLSQREAAEEIGVPYKWLRRMCHRGIERVDRRTSASLERLTGYFGFEVGALWKEGAVPVRLPRKSYPLVKWKGSKRREAPTILKHFPSQIETYWEPFLGSGAVLYGLLSSGIQVREIRCGDICRPLIDLWELVKRVPRRLFLDYERMWGRLRHGGKDYYDKVRAEFNETGDPCLFFFLLRTCQNGLVRFNKAGEFTAAFHHQRRGTPPEKLRAVLADWSEKLRRHDVQFQVGSYEQVQSQEGDLLYLDPPYRTRQGEFYYGSFDFERFFQWLHRQQGGYLLSLNGFVGDEDRRVEVPQGTFDEEVQIPVGRSPYRPLAPPVTHSLYVKRE